MRRKQSRYLIRRRWVSDSGRRPSSGKQKGQPQNPSLDISHLARNTDRPAPAHGPLARFSWTQAQDASSASGATSLFDVQSGQDVRAPNVW